MRSEAEIHELVETGHYLDAARAIDALPTPSNFLRVIRARLELDVGSLSDARDMAEALLRGPLTEAGKSSCWATIGQVDLRAGQTERGLKAMHSAFSAAKATRDPRIEARLIIGNTEAILAWIGIEPATAELPRLRQAAISTGDPYCLIAFHSLVGELKAKKGLLASAKQSVLTARNLLERWPNVWQQGQLAIRSAGIHIIESDYQLALESTKEALGCGTISGSRRLRLPALGNLAHIKLAQGKFDEAREAITQYMSTVTKGGGSEIAGRDTEMEIALASGDLSFATELARNIREVSSNLTGGSSYHGLWHVLTRIKWLFQRGEIEEGVSLALDSIPVVRQTRDRNLLDRLKLLAAEGLCRAGRSTEAASLLAAALGDDRDPPLEILAEAMRVTGRLTAGVDRAAAMAHFERAARVFQAIGNVTAYNEVARNVVETLGEPLRTLDAHGTRLTAASFTERIAAAVEFAILPPLLAREFFSLIIDTESVVHAAVVTTQSDGRREVLTRFDQPGALSASDDHPDAVRIALGTHHDCQYEIVAVPLPNASAGATILAIQRLARSALAVTRARILELERAALFPEPTPEQQLGLISVSERMLDLIKTIRRVAGANVTVLLTGETGVGKELFARALHRASARSDRIFLPFNCSTVPRDMFDSQLFGHKRGSFTGANDDSPGVIKSAAGGTLFLDEIGEMTLDTQPKLLRFLESGEIRPLGDAKPQLVDVRIVAATNANLDQLVAEGKFREDLYYRLNVIRINIPPLRERREEIPALTQFFLERFEREFQKAQIRLADETLEYLVLYRWPGNVRQLANEIRRLVALAEPGAVLMPAHLSDDIIASRKTMPAERPAPQSTEVVTRIDQPLTSAVQHIERAAIQRAMALAEGNLIEAAKMLGLSRKGLYLKRQRLGLE